MKRVTYINLVLGVWLLVIPIVFGTFALSRRAAVNNVALGVLLIASSWWIASKKTAQVPVSGFQLLCGVWLIIGSFVLRYRGFSQLVQNDLIVGALVVIVSMLETWTLWRAPIKAVH
jgi:hypothetical protein